MLDGEWNNIIKFYSFCQEFTLNDLPGVVHLMDFTKSLIGFKEPNKSLKTYFVHENFSNGNLFKIIPDYLENHYPGINSTVRSKIIFGVASTMKYAHRRKIPHLKLELENIYIDENYEPRIANFTNDHKFSSQYELRLFLTVRTNHKMPLIPEYIANKENKDDSNDHFYSMKFTDIYI